MKLYRFECDKGIGPYHNANSGYDIKMLLHSIDERFAPGPRGEFMEIIGKHMNWEEREDYFDLFRFNYLNGDTIFCFKSIELMREWFCHKIYGSNVVNELIKSGFKIVEYNVGNNSDIINLTTQTILKPKDIKKLNKTDVTSEYADILISKYSSRTNFKHKIERKTGLNIIKRLNKLKGKEL